VPTVTGYTMPRSINMPVNKNPLPITQPTLRIEKFISNMFREQVAHDEEEIKKFMTEAGWVAAEMEHWKSRCEELEIELEVMRNAFPEHDNDVQPKIRGQLTINEY
jgi:hypothetical protein